MIIRDKIKEKYKRGAENIEKLKETGALVMYGVDATKMHEDYQVYLGKYEPEDKYRRHWNDFKDDPQQNRKLDTAVMNFPYAGETYKSAYRWSNKTHCHEELIGSSFRGMSRILTSSGEVIITLNAGMAHDWKVNDLAAQAGFELVAFEPFVDKDFPGYQPKQGCGETPDSPFGLNDATTYIYKLKENDDKPDD